MRFPNTATHLSRLRVSAPRWLGSSGILWAVLLTAAAEEVPPRNATPVLTSIHEVRSLTRQQAKCEIPVKLRCVVTFSKRTIATLFVHDGQEGIFVEQTNGPDEQGPHVGDEVEVKGITSEGMFATVIKGVDSSSAEVTVLRHGALPEPRTVTGSELSRPNEDCDWVSVDAWVHEVTMEGGNVVLGCRADTCEFHVLIQGPLSTDSVPWDFAESRVRLRGVVATTFNSNRQMTGRFLRVTSLGDVTPLAGESEKEPVPRMVRAEELMKADGPGPGQLVRIRGVSTYSRPGLGLFLQVEDGGLWVQTAQPVSASPGSVIEVMGWPHTGEIKPFIRARRASVIGVTTPPEPIKLKAGEALQASNDGQLVSLEAELLNLSHSPDGTALEFHDSGLVFRGLVPDNAGPLPEGLVPGARIRFDGIARITSAGNFTLRKADKLQVLARSASDVRVLAPPPFWTASNVSMVSIAAIATLLGLYGIARARRKREQETQRREFEAVLAERGRFAREIHDSLAQGLTSISLQLECVRDRMTDDPATAATHVEKARGFVRDSLREARRTIWNLRPLALGEADLATALKRFADNLTPNGTISFRQEIEGTPHPLPPAHEETLLRIGQEALTNAARHASATAIRQRLRFGPGWVTLTVQDNGRGFDVSEKQGKGFGLTGMHERVAALGGSLSIDSLPGQGTEVSATLPL